jgi:hypothetical protein
MQRLGYGWRCRESMGVDERGEKFPNHHPAMPYMIPEIYKATK